MHRRLLPFPLVRWGLVAGLLLSPGCQASEPQAGGYSNWLRSCDGDLDCGPDSCICGICTVTCDDATTCKIAEGLDAVCIDPAAAVAEASCGKTVLMQSGAKGLCFRGCDSGADCDGSDTCSLGACLPTEVVGTDPLAVGSVPDASDTEPPGCGTDCIDPRAVACARQDAGAPVDCDACPDAPGCMQPPAPVCVRDAGVGADCDGCGFDSDRCDGTCIPVDYDSANCGACGRSCGGFVCDYGTCRGATGWQTRVRLDDAAGASAGDPRVTADDAGNFMVVWTQSDGVRSHLWGNLRRVDDGLWQGPRRMAQSRFYSASDPSIASGGGASMVAWTMHNGTREVVYALHHDWASGITSDAVEIPGQSLFDARDAKLVVTPFGDALVVWGEAEGQFYAHFDGQTGLWGDALPIGGEFGVANGSLALHAHDDGDITAAWVAVGSVEVSRFSAQALTWGATQNIDSVNPGTSSYLHLSGSPGDGAIAMWKRAQAVWWSRLDGGTATWGVASLIENGPLSFETLRAGFDDAGDGLITYRADNTDMLQRYHDGSGSWGDPRAIAGPVMWAYQAPLLRIAGTGTAAFIVANTYRIGGLIYDAQTDTISAEEPLEHAKEHIYGFDAAFDGQGHAEVTWREEGTQIWSHRYQ